MAKPLHERLRGLLPDKVREKIPEKWQPPAWRAPVYAPSPWAGAYLEWNPGDPAEVPLGAYALGDAKGREIEHYIPPGTKGKVVAVAEGFVVFSDGQAGYQLLKSDVRSLVPKKERKWAAAGGEHKFPRLSESARSALEIYIFDPVHAEFGDVFPGRLEGSTLYVTKGQEDRAADLLDAASNSAYDDKDTKLVNALVTLYTKVRRAPRTAEARKADLLPGGQGDDLDDSVFDEVELEMGIEDELEHTSDPDVAKEIAKDHLVGDPSYYSKMGQYESVVYHGSREPDIEALEGGMPPYAGGIGAGVYVAFDPEVAAFYGPYVYELRLHVPPGEILWLTPDTIDYSLGELLPNSILVGEQVLPFSFHIGDQKYSVVADEREALEAIAAREMRNALREAGGEWEAFREHFEASSRWLDVDDAYEYLADGFAEQGFDVETAEAKAHEMAEWYRGLETQVLANAEKQLGLAIDLSEIGGEAAAAGYRAVYLEGVRAGGTVDSELLVFDPADLEMLGQTRTAAGLGAEQAIDELARGDKEAAERRRRGAIEVMAAEMSQARVAGPERISVLKAKYPDVDPARVDRLAQGDPTQPKYGYLDWMIRQVRGGADEQKVISLVHEFHTERSRLPVKDIGRLNAQSLEEMLANMPQTERRAPIKRVVYDKDGWRVTQAFNQAALNEADPKCVNPDGSWCVSRFEQGHFEQYVKQSGGRAWGFYIVEGPEKGSPWLAYTTDRVVQEIRDRNDAVVDASSGVFDVLQAAGIDVSRVLETVTYYYVDYDDRSDREYRLYDAEHEVDDALAEARAMNEQPIFAYIRSLTMLLDVANEVVQMRRGEPWIKAFYTSRDPRITRETLYDPWQKDKAIVAKNADGENVAAFESLDEAQEFIARAQADGVDTTDWEVKTTVLWDAEREYLYSRGLNDQFERHGARRSAAYYKEDVPLSRVREMWAEHRVKPWAGRSAMIEVMASEDTGWDDAGQFSGHYDILDRVAPGATWGTGGCWILAAAIGGQLFMVKRADGVIDHIVAKVGADRYQDADGLHSASELEQAFGGKLIPLDEAEAWWQGEIPYDANAVAELQQRLRRTASDDSPARRLTAAGLPAVGDAAKKFAAEVKQGIDQVRGAEYELRPGLFPDKASIEKMLNDVSDVIVSGRGRVPLTSYLDLDLVRSEEARARLKRIGTFVVVDGRTNHGGWFSPSAQLIGINVSPHELTYNSSWQIWQRIKTTFEHEVRHAIDWAYNPDAFVAANPGEESTGAAPKTRRWWTRYLNQPTELMAWAGNIAAALAIRPSSWERLKWSLDDYKVWVEKEGSVRVLDLVKEENKKRLLQMILKAYDQANPPGEKGPNKWQIMKSDLLAKRKIPESFVASLLPFVYGVQKREGMASEPTWQEWVKNRSTDQIVMEAENNYAVYKILRALPKNALDEYPPLAPMIDDWRQKHGLPYTMRPETADAWSAWERAS